MASKKRPRNDAPGQLDFLTAPVTIRIETSSPVCVVTDAPREKPDNAMDMGSVFRRAMELEDRDFHAVLLSAARESRLDLVAFAKRVNGVLYHQLNSLKKHSRV